jgi:predicted nucleotidyltransferase
MPTDQEFDRLKGAAAAVLAGAPVRFAYLYGSVARGDAHPGSDVDIAVMFDRSVPAKDRLRQELALGLTFDARLGGERADVRDLATMPLILRGRVVTEGALLFSRDEKGRVAFEVATRNEYFDFLPVYRAYQEESLARMSGGAGRG